MTDFVLLSLMILTSHKIIKKSTQNQSIILFFYFSRNTLNLRHFICHKNDPFYDR